jgi:hypothetical protein
MRLLDNVVVRRSPPRSIDVMDAVKAWMRAKGHDVPDADCSVLVARQRYVTPDVLFIKVMAPFAGRLAGCFAAPPLNRASDRPDLATRHVILRFPPQSSLRW